MPSTDLPTSPNLMRFHLSLLLLVMAGLVVAFAPLPVPTTTPQERTFEIDAHQFAYSPSEFHVNPGDTVTIQLVSTDVVHGLYVDDYDISIEADPGQSATLTFVADKPGSFRFRCNVTCGAMHPFILVISLDWFVNPCRYRLLSSFSPALACGASVF